MSSQNPAPLEDSLEGQDAQTPWYKLLTRYHWFVFVVCCLGWGFDCFDQQLFNVLRNRALGDLMRGSSDTSIIAMGTYATSAMLIGWALGGIFFGIMGDKIGRAKTMIATIFVYAIFTGLSGLATSWWDFMLYRFLTGMGVGGQFAAGVTLLSETMPDRARAKSLGTLQIVAAFCNLCAASLVMGVGFMEQQGFFPAGMQVWRPLFFVGFLPALLAIFVMRKLEEPEKWKNAIKEGGAAKAGSIKELFTHPRWRHNIIIGMLLATCGVIGLWGIGFFSVDLTRTFLRNRDNQTARDQGDVQDKDFQFVRMLVHAPSELLPIAEEKKITISSFLDNNAKTNDPGAIFLAVSEDAKSGKDSKIIPGNAESVLDMMNSATPEERQRRAAILAVAPKSTDVQEFTQITQYIAERHTRISGYATLWGALTSMLFNLGAVIGTWIITLCAEKFGRRPAFTIFFVASLVMTVLVFLFMDSEIKIVLMVPLLGFCALSLFGGYAIYFPELFPTHLRSTAVSFCYNIGRFAAATGPAGLGLLTHYVFHEAAEPIRYAGAAMSVTFIFGIIFTWMGPETKGKPLPE